MKYILSADIGGTTIKLGLFNHYLDLIDSWIIETNNSTDAENEIFNDIQKSFVEKLNLNSLTLDDVLGCGISIPAPIVNKSFLANKCANLNLPKNLDISTKFNFEKSIPLVIDNDANMALIGENACGSEELCNNVVMLTIGTGIGGAIIANGEILNGANGGCGEIGHALFPNIHLRQLSNSNYSEFEHLTSGIYFEKLAKKYLNFEEYNKSILHKIGVSPKNIFDNPEDVLCKDLIYIYVENFAQGISYICSLLNPEKIIIGGGMSKAKNLLDHIIPRLKEITWDFSINNTKLEIATLGNSAGIYGCAVSVLQNIYGKLFINLIKLVGAKNISTNVLGKDITTFKIGGTIKYFVTPEKVTDLANLIKYCNLNNVNYFIIGSGSNVLIDDEGYNGIIISLKKLYKSPSKTDNFITATASTSLKEVAEFAYENSLKGMEFYHDIPGSVGGGLFMNCGAYGGETKDIVYHATIITPDGCIKSLNNEELSFGYRNSIVRRNRYVVVDVTYKLNYGNKKEIKSILDDLYSKRIEKQPLEYPSAGSIFKRPVNNFAGKLIMDSNLKGQRIGDAAVSTKHAGFIINLGNATSSNVQTLINLIIDVVNRNFNITLETEVIILK